MSALVTFKPVSLALRDGQESGRLVFADDLLVAVVAQDAGRWRIRAGFGRCADGPREGFATLQDISVWIGTLLGWREAVAVCPARYPST